MVSDFVLNPRNFTLTVFSGPVSVEYHSIDAEVFNSIHHRWMHSYASTYMLMRIS